MSIPMTATPTKRQRPHLLDVIAALLALITASALVRLSPLRMTLAIVGALKRVTRRSARSRETERVIAARDWTSRWFPNRVACMERSLAAFLMCCARGTSVDWCLGCRFDPCEAHAWIESAGQPVGEPDSPGRPLHVTLRV